MVVAAADMDNQVAASGVQVAVVAVVGIQEGDTSAAEEDNRVAVVGKDIRLGT